MGKKFIKRAVCGVLAAVSMLAFAACDLESSVINAYDVAVKNGFTGTEEEWLQSLKGANGKDGQDLDIEKIYDAAVKNGYEAFVFFVIQMDGCKYFTPNRKTDPDFARALEQAAADGVQLRAVTCRVAENRLEIDDFAEIRL